MSGKNFEEYTLGDALRGLRKLGAALDHGTRQQTTGKTLGRLWDEFGAALYDEAVGQKYRPIKIKDVMAGDEFWEDGKLVWTAVEDMKEINNVSWTVLVRYNADKAVVFRTWPYDVGDESPEGLKRPVKR